MFSVCRFLDISLPRPDLPVGSLPETHLCDGSDGGVRRGGRLEEHVAVDVAQLDVGGDLGVDVGVG